MPAIASEETIQKIFHIPGDELIRQMDSHTMMVQGWLASRSAQAARFQGRGIQASSTGYKIRLLNLALGCNFSADTSDRDIECEIEALKEFFASRDVPWLWWMNACPTPEHIGTLLEYHGLTYNAPALPAMAASLLEDATEIPGYPADIQVWQAQTIEDLRAASRIRHAAFRFREGEALSYFEDMSADWLEHSGVTLLLAGPRESQPVSMGALIEGAGIAGIYVMATLPDHHRQGYGKAILTQLMERARSQGHSMLVLTASTAGFGLYSQFGFHHIFDFDFYSLP